MDVPVATYPNLLNNTFKMKMYFMTVKEHKLSMAKLKLVLDSFFAANRKCTDASSNDCQMFFSKTFQEKLSPKNVLN